LLFTEKRVILFLVHVFGSKSLSLIGDVLMIGRNFLKHCYVQKCSSFYMIPGVAL
jgi:hypothetical protein